MACAAVRPRPLSSSSSHLPHLFLSTFWSGPLKPTLGRPVRPDLLPASLPWPRSRVEGLSVTERHRWGSRQGMAPISETSKKRGAAGLTLAAVPRAHGYPTLSLPPEGSGGFNVSERSARGCFFFCYVPYQTLVCEINPWPPFLEGGETNKKSLKLLTTLSGGSLGSCVDEERS